MRLSINVFRKERKRSPPVFHNPYIRGVEMKIECIGNTAGITLYT